MIAVVPWTPQRANAFRSAWIPAPPPESEAAMVNATGMCRFDSHADKASDGRYAARAAPARCASTVRRESDAQIAPAPAAPARLRGARVEPRCRRQRVGAVRSPLHQVEHAGSSGSSAGPAECAAVLAAPGPSITSSTSCPSRITWRPVVEQAVRPRRSGGADPARYRADLPIQELRPSSR